MKRNQTLRWLAALAVVAIAAAVPAVAADYIVHGTVRQIASADARNEDLAIADLPLGDAMPFVQVAVFDRSSGAELGRSWTGESGSYSVSFSAGTPVDVEVRVFRVADGGLSPLVPAREGINDLTLTSLGPVTSVGHLARVESDLITEAGSASALLPYPGVGIVFTRVGKVEIPFIEQDTTLAGGLTAADLGLADLSGDLARAAELGLPSQANQAAHRAVFRDAPFAGRLLIFGSFGLPGGAPSCGFGPPDYYQIQIHEVDLTTLPSDPPGTVGAPIILQDPLNKTEYAVQTFPTIDVVTQRVNIGPYSGHLNVAQPAPDTPGLYMVNAAPPSTTRQVFYSFPDLRANWVTSGYNGLYRLTMKYYRHLSWAVPNDQPVVAEIDPACFVSPPPALSDSAVGDLVVRLDNRPLVTRFDGIWQTNGGYLRPDGTRGPTKTGALDFNGAGLCEIMELDAGDQIEIDFTARHDGGYLRFYRLGAVSNDGASVPYTGDDWVGKPFPWNGVTGASATNSVPFPHRCAYIFDLVAASRLQNGYHYLQRHHRRRAFYVMPFAP